LRCFLKTITGLVLLEAALLKAVAQSSYGKILEAVAARSSYEKIHGIRRVDKRLRLRGPHKPQDSRLKTDAMINS
jgi:hypothetical protein